MNMIYDPMLIRVAVLLVITKRRQQAGDRFGKTAAQKLLYLLQEGLRVPLGYRFNFYTYGPYSSAVMSDIDYGAAIGILDVHYEGDWGYKITSGPAASDLEAYQNEIQRQHGEALDQLFVRFGRMSATDLELRATLLYVYRDEPSLDLDGIVARTANLKPKFVRSQIEAAARDLNQYGWLTGAAPSPSHKEESSPK